MSKTVSGVSNQQTWHSHLCPVHSHHPVFSLLAILLQIHVYATADTGRGVVMSPLSKILYPPLCTEAYTFLVDELITDFLEAFFSKFPKWHTHFIYSMFCRNQSWKKNIFLTYKRSRYDLFFRVCLPWLLVIFKVFLWVHACPPLVHIL